MVTGKSHMDITGRRHLTRGGKKKGRRDRHAETQRPVEAEEDDSSDLSDESDDEGEMPRYVDPILAHWVTGYLT